MWSCRKVGVCGLLLLVAGGSHFGKNGLGPLEDLLCAALATGPAGFGLLNAVVTVPGAVLPIVAGAVYDHVSGPSVLVSALVVVLLGQLLFLWSCTASIPEVSGVRNLRLVLALGSLFIFGAGAGAIDTLQKASLAALLKNKHLGMGMGVTVFATNLWRLLSDYALPSLGYAFGLRWPLAVIVGVCCASLASGGAWAVYTSRFGVYKAPDSDKVPKRGLGRCDGYSSQPSALEDFVPGSMGGKPKCSVDLWLLCLLHMLLMATVIGFSNIAPKYLSDRGEPGFDQVAASKLVATSMRPGTLVGAVLGGLVADYGGCGRSSIVAAAAILASFMLLGAPGEWIGVPFAVPLAVIGVAHGSLTTMILAWIPLVSARGRKAGTGLGYGIMEAMSAMGECCGNLAIGFATARCGLALGAWALIVCGSSCCLVLAVLLALSGRAKQLKQTSKVEPISVPLLGAHDKDAATNIV